MRPTEIIILLSDPAVAGMFVQLASSLHLPLILLHRHNGAAKRKVCITYNNTARVCPECLDNICYVDSPQETVQPPPLSGLTFLLGKSQIIFTFVLPTDTL